MAMSSKDSLSPFVKKLATVIGVTHFTLSSKSAFAAALTGATAAFTSSALGFDPLAWGIGGLGGAFICLRGELLPRKEAAANIMLSIMLGGIASPVAYAMVAAQYPQLANIPGQYLIAIIFCFGWPQITKIMVSLLMRRYGNNVNN
jgi:hypothetical protein